MVVTVRVTRSVGRLGVHEADAVGIEDRAQREGDVVRTVLAERQPDRRRAVDPDELALATLAALQGGLLLTQIQRSTKPLQTALDAVLALIAYEAAA